MKYMGKNIGVIIIALLMIGSCSENINNKQEANISSVLPDLFLRNDCATCHKINEVFVGPSYLQVAERYPATAETTDTLTKSIINGSTGKWGTSPMMAHPALSQQDAKAMADFIMSMKK